MIVARGESKDDEQFLLLGLTHKNIDRLLSGQPILVQRRTHGEGVPDGWIISLVAGKNEEDIASQLKKGGLITDMTSIFRDPKLGRDPGT